MVTITHSAAPLSESNATCLALAVGQGATDGLPTLLGVELAAACAALDVTGERDDVATVPASGRLVLVVGTGADGHTPDALRRAAAIAARNAPKGATLAFEVPEGGAAGAVATGLGLGAYAYNAYRRKNPDAPDLEQLIVHGGAAADVERAATVVTAVWLARDLVNTPPRDKRPPALAARVADAVADRGVAVTIRDEEWLAAEGFGGVLGVGQGSSEPPRLVELSYEPASWDRHVVLVGKGITFDSGGLSLKPSDSMMTMKSDMAGAAAVVGTLSACRELGVAAKVTGLAALAENMPSGSAQRVSDVITHRGGTTVEVMNTDAEGRLVLADALAYASEQEPDAIVDLATLTGAQVVALGNDVAAVMGTDDALVEALLAAGEAAGEPHWRLPLVASYREHLESTVADLKNIGKPKEAGSIVAALFLQRFVGDRAWAHIDLAGPAFGEGDNALRAPGGTGFGVATLLEWLRS